MSLKDEFEKSRKLNSRLKAEIAFMDGSTDPDQPLFSAIIKLKGNTPITIDGAKISQNGAGNIFTAHDISLNGLKNLIDHSDVVYIDGSTPLFAERSDKPPRKFSPRD